MSYQKTKERLRLFACNGLLEIDRLLLLPSEFRLLKKEGVTVNKQETKNGARDKVFFCHVSWKDAYPEGIPLAVLEYTSRKAMAYPKNHVKNFAQELYIIAIRASTK